MTLKLHKQLKSMPCKLHTLLLVPHGFYSDLGFLAPDIKSYSSSQLFIIIIVLNAIKTCLIVNEYLSNNKNHESHVKIPRSDIHYKVLLTWIKLSQDWIHVCKEKRNPLKPITLLKEKCPWVVTLDWQNSFLRLIIQTGSTVAMARRFLSCWHIALWCLFEH